VASWGRKVTSAANDIARTEPSNSISDLRVYWCGQPNHQSCKVRLFLSRSKFSNKAHWGLSRLFESMFGILLFLQTHNAHKETANYMRRFFLRSKMLFVNIFMRYFIHTQSHFRNVSPFSFVKPSSGNSSLPLRISLPAWIALRRSLERSGPQREILNPCLRIL
jgi:hypothetical protein